MEVEGDAASSVVVGGEEEGGESVAKSGLGKLGLGILEC